MTERETFSVQGLFDQLILAYDNPQSMEIAAKELSKMKQGNKQPFSTFISGFEKKMLETGGMDFSDQVTKTFLNNAFNNEMHKTFIGFFIPATYIAYCTMLHKTNNRLKALRSKNWTTTTVTRITKSFTTVNSIMNDEMDWEPTVTNSFTKMVKQKAKWVSPAIITKRREKRACFRCGIVGHRVNKCPLLPARRPVVTAATTTTTTTIPKTTIEKIDSEKK